MAKQSLYKFQFETPPNKSTLALQACRKASDPEICSKKAVRSCEVQEDKSDTAGLGALLPLALRSCFYISLHESAQIPMWMTGSYLSTQRWKNTEKHSGWTGWLLLCCQNLCFHNYIISFRSSCFNLSNRFVLIALCEN